jgi:hypothetical protein
MLWAVVIAESKTYNCCHRPYKMKWIEIIELRSTSNAWKELETILQEFIKQVEKETEKQTVKLYTRMINTDFSIHLFHDSGKIKNSGSPLGIKLVSALKSYGLVNHTIWTEKQKDSIT